MAFSSTLKKTDVQGTVTVQIYDINMAAVTAGYIKTGFSNILFADANNETTPASGKVKINRNSTDTAAEGGGIYLSNFTANDLGSLMVFGN